MENKVLMPKATALWLKLNTKLTMEQISIFCGIDLLTLDSLTYDSMKTSNPLRIQQLTEAEILKGENDQQYQLKNFLNLRGLVSKNRRKYIPLIYRKRKPEIIHWFLNKTEENRHFDEVFLKSLARVLSTSMSYIKRNVEMIKNNPEENKIALDPVSISVCSPEEIQQVLSS